MFRAPSVWILSFAAFPFVTPAPAQEFEDATAESGIAFRHQASKTPRKYLPETMGGGVALLDFDGDGLLDVFLVNGAELRFPHPDGEEPSKTASKYWNRLYRNLGSFRFTDVTEEAGLAGRGYGMGAAVGDYDNDGDPDLLVTAVGTGDVAGARLYRNESGERFVDVTESAGLRVRGWATSAGFFDYDADGHLDLFVARYMDWRFDQDRRCGLETTYGRSYCHPDLFPAIANQLFHGNGDGTFTDVTASSGIGGQNGKALGIAFADFDRDGREDIAVANDSHPQFLFLQRGAGRFEEAGLLGGMAYDEDGNEFAGMGIAAADLNEDGWTDIVTTTLSQQRYALFHGGAEATFEYATPTSGLGTVTQLLAGWGVVAADFDLDGDRDLVFANGHVMDNIEQSQPSIRYKQPPLLLHQADGVFRDGAGRGGSPFSTPLAGRGATAGDLDNDGDLDVVLAQLDGRAVILRNRAQEESAAAWLGVRLAGCPSNRDAIGAEITLTLEGGERRFARVGRAGSYLSARDPRVYFGLGASGRPAMLKVQWPSGQTLTIEEPDVRKFLRINEQSGEDCR